MIKEPKRPGQTDGAADVDLVLWLVCRTGQHLCALPLDGVVEIMRPLPVERLAQAPRFVRGVSIIRGVPMPVVDAGALFSDQRSEYREDESGRLVTVRAGNRIVAFGVGSVVGVRSIAASACDTLPPLLRETDGGLIAAIGTLDAELLLFLQTARIVPDELMRDLAKEGQSS